MIEIHAPATIRGSVSPEMRIALATLAAGALDLIYAFTLNAAYGVAPGRVLQFIGSGLLGDSAFHGGAPSAALGAFAHFGLIALFASAVAFVGSLRQLPRMHPLAIGAVAGAILFVVMNYIVAPLSRTPPLPPLPMERVLLEIVVHTVLIGPLVALLVLRPPRGSEDMGQEGDQDEAAA